MSSTDVLTEFTNPLRRAFGDPVGVEANAFFSLVTEHLAKFSRETLSAAREHILLDRVARGFPPIAECVKACEKADANLRRHAVVAAPMPPRAETVADRLMDSDLGREAAAGNWISTLWRWCRDHQRLPEGKEIDEVFEEAQKIYAAAQVELAKCRASPSELNKHLLAMWDGMQKRNEGLKELAHGKNREAS